MSEKPANVPINFNLQGTGTINLGEKTISEPPKSSGQSPSLKIEVIFKFVITITVTITLTVSLYLPIANVRTIKDEQLTRTPNKLPPPLAYSSADYLAGYEGHTVLVDSFTVTRKTEAYYLAGQLRAAQTKSFVVLRPNKQLYVCVGNNKTKRQAASIRDYLNSRYELRTVILSPEMKQ